MNAKCKTQPLSSVRWVDPKNLRSNSYNPNRVFTPELRLLKLSIIENGWTQPIVARTDGEIIDGFHRWTLATRDEDVRQLTDGLCPVVYVENLTPEEQMIATVRHNRARGQHGILKMGEIVRSLLEAGMGEEMVSAALQMDPEEVVRLSDVRGSPVQAGKDHFGKGWAPKR